VRIRRFHQCFLRSFLLFCINAVNLFNGHYYEVREDLANFTTANASATAATFLGVKGHIVTLNTAEEVAFVSDINGFGWVAGGDAATEGTYVYTAGPETGQRITYLPWAVSQPDNGSPVGIDQDCMQIWNNTALPSVLDDVGCTSTLKYVIEYECPAGLEFNATACQSKVSCNAFSRYLLLEWICL
jgi:hypothetical protein